MRRDKKSQGAALFVAAGILLSRISGLVRERVFAHYLGNSAAAGAFKAALRIPNFLQNMFGEGVLSASFIPVYAQLLAKGDRALATRVANAVFSILSLGVSVLVLLGVSFTPAFVDLVAPGFEGDVRLLTIRCVRILFPGVGVLVLSAWCLGILNSHRKFFLSYVATVFWNLAMIAALIFYGGHSSKDDLAVDLAWASVAGSLLQLGVQLPFVFMCGERISFTLRSFAEPTREVFRNLGPVFVSRGVVQVSAYIDAMIASFLGASAVSSLAYAQTIYLLPVSLFGMSVAAAELPEMSSALGDPEEIHGKLRERLSKGLGTISFFVVPSVVAFLLIGKFVVAALYQTGVFRSDDTLYVWYILGGSVIGLLAQTWGRLYSSAFYALRDTKTPLRFAVIRVILTAILGVLFAFPLRPLVLSVLLTVGLKVPSLPGIELGLGAVGLTASAGIAGWIEFLLLRRALHQRIGHIGTAVHSRRELGRFWITALLAAAAALACKRFVFPLWPLHFAFLRYDFVPLAVVAVFGAVYLCFNAGKWYSRRK